MLSLEKPAQLSEAILRGPQRRTPMVAGAPSRPEEVEPEKDIISAAAEASDQLGMRPSSINAWESLAASRSAVRRAAALGRTFRQDTLAP